MSTYLDLIGNILPAHYLFDILCVVVLIRCWNPFYLIQEGKTALYWAVEKGYVEICKLLLNSEPDLEIANKVC